MAENNNEPLIVNNSATMVESRPAQFIPVKLHEWKNLKENIRMIKHESNYWDSFGWASIGASLSLVVQIWTTVQSIANGYFIVGLLLLLGIACIITGRTKKMMAEVTATQVLGHIKLIEEQFQINNDI